MDGSYTPSRGADDRDEATHASSMPTQAAPIAVRPGQPARPLPPMPAGGQSASSPPPASSYAPYGYGGGPSMANLSMSSVSQRSFYTDAYSATLGDESFASANASAYPSQAQLDGTASSSHHHDGASTPRQIVSPPPQVPLSAAAAYAAPSHPGLATSPPPRIDGSHGAATPPIIATSYAQGIPVITSPPPPPLASSTMTPNGSSQGAAAQANGNGYGHAVAPPTTSSRFSTAPSAAAGAGAGTSVLTALNPKAPDNWLPSRYAAAFMGTIIIEAIVVIVMISLTFAKIESRTPEQVDDIKTVAVYLSIFLFAMIFGVIIALDANRLRNTIQVIGVCIFNFALIITAALEITQVQDSLQAQDALGRGIPCQPGEPRLRGSGGRCSAERSLFPTAKRYLIVVPVIVGAAQVPLTVLAFKLWGTYGWDVYKKIGADLEMRRRYLVYQVFVVFLKFDFFFGVAFTMAYLILVSNRDDAEYGLTIAAIPCAIVVLFLAAFAAHKELRSVMTFAIMCFFAGAGYFIYKITRIYASSTAYLYFSVRRTLTFFSIFATICLFASIVLAILCLMNFGKGLLVAHTGAGSSRWFRRGAGVEMDNETGEKITMRRRSEMLAAPKAGRGKPVAVNIDDRNSQVPSSRITNNATRLSLD